MCVCMYIYMFTDMPIVHTFFDHKIFLKICCILVHIFEKQGYYRLQSHHPRIKLKISTEEMANI